MTERFTDLKKLPSAPAARLMANAGLKLSTRLKAPASASVAAVLSELETRQAWVDMVLLLAVALPPREGVWWACLAARDILGAAPPTTCLAAAEAWVFKPAEEDLRLQLQSVVDAAEIDDPASHCATAALYAPGNMGPGEMAEHPAPPAVVAASIFAMNMDSIKGRDDPIARMRFLIERALDIARGGNGRLTDPENKEEIA